MEEANACPSIQKPVVGASVNNKLFISKNPINTYSSWLVISFAVLKFHGVEYEGPRILSCDTCLFSFKLKSIIFQKITILTVSFSAPQISLLASFIS